MEHWLLTERANGGSRPGRFITLYTLRFPLARSDLGHPPAFRAIGAVYESHRLKQPLPIAGGNALEHASIRRDRFQKADGVEQPLQDCRHFSYVSRLLERMTARVRTMAPQPSNAMACGQSVSRPTPFKNIPRRITTK